jgi:hypothetical protein
MFDPETEVAFEATEETIEEVIEGENGIGTEIGSEEVAE